MTTVVLEGDEIDALLARVSSEHGPQARVVRAEKVRVGGVAGFFARQRFEVVVEVDDDGPDSRRGGSAEDDGTTGRPADDEEDGDVRARQQDGTPGADGWQEETRREEVLEDLFDSPIARALVRAQVLEEAVDEATRRSDGVPEAAPESASAAGGLGALLDAADAGDAHRSEQAAGAGAAGRHAVPSQPLEPSRPVSTESAAFAAVLDAVRDAAEPDASAPRARTGEEDPAGRDRQDATSGAVAGDPDEEVVPVGPEPVPAGAAVAELMGLLAARHAAAARAGGSPEEVEPAEETEQDEAVEPADVARAEAVTPRAAASSAAAPRTAAPAPTGMSPDGGVRSRAAAAGLPANLLDRLPVGAGAADLREVLASLPAAPAVPEREGDLVVVVGAPRDALVVARSVASRLGLGPDGVVVAARPGGGVLRREVVRDAATARRAAATVRLGDAPGVVIVQADCDPDDVRWARDVVTALRADQVHAVVDATRKPADTDRWFDAVLAEDPDAVHVVRAAGSADPGSALGLDLPVAGVDGAAAGADVWLELLLREPAAPPADAPVRARRRRAAPAGRP